MYALDSDVVWGLRLSSRLELGGRMTIGTWGVSVALPCEEQTWCESTQGPDGAYRLFDVACTMSE